MRIAVRVHPRASAVRVESKAPAECDVWVTAAPVKDKANEAAAKALADHFGVAKSRVRLVRGARSRLKVFEVIV